jgi:hypothetical protein
MTSKGVAQLNRIFVSFMTHAGISSPPRAPLTTILQ